jgi:hypothetical protein
MICKPNRMIEGLEGKKLYKDMSLIKSQNKAIVQDLTHTYAVVTTSKKWKNNTCSNIINFVSKLMSIANLISYIIFFCSSSLLPQLQI